MKQLRLPVLIITVLFLLCFLIPSGAAQDPALPDNSSPEAALNISVYCSLLGNLPKNAVIHGPETLYYRYSVDPGSTKLDITLQWDAVPGQNPLKLQITAPNGETFGPYHDTINDRKIHKLISSSTLPSGKWIIAVTQTAVETTPFVLTIHVPHHATA